MRQSKPYQFTEKRSDGCADVELAFSGLLDLARVAVLELLPVGCGKGSYIMLWNIRAHVGYDSVADSPSDEAKAETRNQASHYSAAARVFTLRYGLALVVPVFLLDTRELQKKLQKALKDYMKERWDFEQERENYGITTDNLDSYTLSNEVRRILEKNQFDLDKAVLDVELKDIALKYATLISPISGIVTHIDPLAENYIENLEDMADKVYKGLSKPRN